MSRFGGLGNRFVNRFSEFGPQSRGGYGASPSMEGATPPPIGAVIGANEEAYRQKQVAYNLAKMRAPGSVNPDGSVKPEMVPQFVQQSEQVAAPYQQRATNLKTAYLSNVPLSEIESRQANNTMRQGLVNAEIGEINSRTGLNQAQVDNLRRMGPIQAGAAGRQGMLDTLTMPAKVIGAYRQAFAPAPKPAGFYQAEAAKYSADQRLAGQQYTADARAVGSANTDQMKALQEHLKTLQDYIRKNHKGAITPELEGILGLGQQQQQGASTTGSVKTGETRVLPDGSSATFDGTNWHRNKMGY